MLNLSGKKYYSNWLDLKRGKGLLTTPCLKDTVFLYGIHADHKAELEDILGNVEQSLGQSDSPAARARGREERNAPSREVVPWCAFVRGCR